MYIRDHRGHMVIFNWSDYTSETSMYRTLWKVMYNIDLPIHDHTTCSELIHYINYG